MLKHMAEKFPEIEFVEFLIKNIVGHPEDVKVVRTVDEMGVLLTLDVNPEDMGYVIGKQGNTARAVRTLLKIVGAKNNARVNLKISEPEGSERPQRAPRTEAEEEVNTDVIDDLKI